MLSQRLLCVFFSPMYVALQFLHVMEYTPLHIFCSSTLSFGLTSDLFPSLFSSLSVLLIWSIVDTAYH